MNDEVLRRTEELARVAYGRLLALLASKCGDLVVAEDCLADAFEAALRTWPDSGVPTNPEAWLLTVARNGARDTHRSASHQRTVSYSPAHHNAIHVVEGDYDADDVPDRQLALLFVCAHPAIDPAVRTPLMLQTVLGFDADRIAAAFVIPPTTMAQRLVRAKRRIREARIPFVIPDRKHLADRLPPVLEAIYGAYAIDCSVTAGPEHRASLASESLYLARLLASLLPTDPEALGLVALLSLSIARRPVPGTDHQFVPLSEQDTSQWDHELIASGEGYLHRAFAFAHAGRFQLEAAIQSVHCARAVTGETDWHALRTLYAALIAVAPTLGARVAYAAAVGRVEGAMAGLAVLNAIDERSVQRFQPAWATRAHLLAEAGDTIGATAAFTRAISLTTDVRARTYLLERRGD